jgi:hypothetical protein
MRTPKPLRRELSRRSPRPDTSRLASEDRALPRASASCYRQPCSRADRSRNWVFGSTREGGVYLQGGLEYAHEVERHSGIRVELQ